MVILNETKPPIVYFGVTKTASTSIRDYLHKYLYPSDPDRYIDGKHNMLLNKESKKYLENDKRISRRLINLDGKNSKFKNYLKIISVRNPYTRILSLYNFTKKEFKQHNLTALNFSLDNFNSFLISIYELWDSEQIYVKRKKRKKKKN